MWQEILVGVVVAVAAYMVGRRFLRGGRAMFNPKAQAPGCGCGCGCGESEAPPTPAGTDHHYDPASQACAGCTGCAQALENLKRG